MRITLKTDYRHCQACHSDQFWTTLHFEFGDIIFTLCQSCTKRLERQIRAAKRTIGAAIE